ncbi:MAG: DUF1800 domain-containing protein [Fuerstiella sp.]|nr:DUF1800 domain-containing protein [Fuerstiella sp.]
MEDKLTLFWHRHLTTSNTGVYMSSALVRQNQLFRRHAAGNVGELILSVSEDPAMMRYPPQSRSAALSVTIALRSNGRPARADLLNGH